MIMPDEDLIYDKIDTPLFHLIGEAADSLGVEAYYEIGRASCRERV